MTILDWFNNLPPIGLNDNGLKLIIYMTIIFVILTAIIVFFSTKAYKKQQRAMPILDLDLEAEAEESAVSIAPEEKIAVLKIEKSKYIAAQKALSDAYRKKEISENVYNRLSLRYASDLKRIEDAIDKATQELEVSRLEEELKKMQGDYLSKLKGVEPTTAVSTPSTPSPPKSPPTPPTPSPTPSTSPPTPTMPATPKPPTAPTPPPPSTVAKPTPSTGVPKPPMPTAPRATPTKPPTAPTMPAPPAPAPKPPMPATPATSASAASTDQTEQEGDLFAKSTSIAALRKEMLKELDRLKKFMSEQQ